MARRNHSYRGSYVQKARYRSIPHDYEFIGTSSRSTFQNCIDKGKACLIKSYYVMNQRYVLVVTILLLGLLSFIVPDVTNKINKSKELKAMKFAVEQMTKEVSQAEAACLTVASDLNILKTTFSDDERETPRKSPVLLDLVTRGCLLDSNAEPVEIEKKVGLFRRIFSPNRNASHKEIAIMSFIYSDSFSNPKGTNNTD